MQTPAEYLSNPIPDNHTLWLDGLDIISHCLQQDSQQTFFKDKYPVKSHWRDWTNGMEQRAENQDNFAEIYENAYQPKKKWRTKQSDQGYFDVDAYIEQEDQLFTERYKELDQGVSVSVLIDIAIPWIEAKDKYMVERHQKVYDLIAQCDSEDRPIQVVAGLGIKVPELSKQLTIFTMVKAYTDNIFPSIWGVLTTNETANAFVNVIMDYFIGTKQANNGMLKMTENAQNFFPEHEELHIFGTRFKADNAHYYK